MFSMNISNILLFSHQTFDLTYIALKQKKKKKKKNFKGTIPT